MLDAAAAQNCNLLLNTGPLPDGRSTRRMWRRCGRSGGGWRGDTLAG